MATPVIPRVTGSDNPAAAIQGYTIGFPLVDKAIYITDSGTVFNCHACNYANMCKHTKFLLQNRTDRVYYFEQVDVPMSIDSAVWVTLVINQSDTYAKGKMAFLASTEVTDDKRDNPALSDSQRYIGLVMPTDSRQNLRDMFDAWIDKYLIDYESAGIKAQCRSKSHGPKQEERWRDPRRGIHYLERWSFIQTGRCTDCAQWSDNTDFSTYVPF